MGADRQAGASALAHLIFLEEAFRLLLQLPEILDFQRKEVKLIEKPHIDQAQFELCREKEELSRLITAWGTLLGCQHNGQVSPLPSFLTTLYTIGTVEVWGTTGLT